MRLARYGSAYSTKASVSLSISFGLGCFPLGLKLLTESIKAFPAKFAILIKEPSANDLTVRALVADDLFPVELIGNFKDVGEFVGGNLYGGSAKGYVNLAEGQ